MDRSEISTRPDQIDKLSAESDGKSGDGYLSAARNPSRVESNKSARILPPSGKLGANFFERGAILALKRPLDSRPGSFRFPYKCTQMEFQGAFFECL